MGLPEITNSPGRSRSPRLLKARRAAASIRRLRASDRPWQKRPETGCGHSRYGVPDEKNREHDQHRRRRDRPGARPAAPRPPRQMSPSDGKQHQPARHLPMRQAAIAPQRHQREEKDRRRREAEAVPGALVGAAWRSAYRPRSPSARRSRRQPQELAAEIGEEAADLGKVAVALRASALERERHPMMLDIPEERPASS